jgi:ADP-ribose pyrophosphatase
MTPEPWTLIRERSQRDYKIFRTRTLDVADPRDGSHHVRTVVEAPDWVNVIPVTEDELVVLVRQFRFGTWSNTLEIPGGMVDTNEDPMAAARRELEEETGFRPRTLRFLGASHPNPAISGNNLHSYLALGCVRAHSGAPESTEDIRVELIPRSQLDDLVRGGAITHSLVLAALLLERLDR